MKVAAIEWDARNRRHFAAHPERAISEDAVADVLLQRCHPHRAADLAIAGKREARCLVYGRTCEGRYVAVVVAPKPGGPGRPGQILRPITAWPLDEGDIQRYLAWRRTVRR